MPVVFFRGLLVGISLSNFVITVSFIECQSRSALKHKTKSITKRIPKYIFFKKMEPLVKKSVSFDELSNTRHIYDGRSTDILWEFPEFFEEARSLARTDGKAARLAGYSKLIEHSFSEPSEDIQKCLNEFAKHSDARGLERFTNRRHYDERKKERAQALQAVLIGQRQAKEQGLSQAVAEEQLREVSLVFCLNAKVFARRLGKADEAACYPKTKLSRSTSSSSKKRSVKSFQSSNKIVTHGRAA